MADCSVFGCFTEYPSELLGFLLYLTRSLNNFRVNP